MSILQLVIFCLLVSLIGLSFGEIGVFYVGEMFFLIVVGLGLICFFIPEMELKTQSVIMSSNLLWVFRAFVFGSVVGLLRGTLKMEQKN